VLASQNSGKAYVYGFSSSLKSASFRNFILLASANYTHGRIKSGNTLTPLDHISPLMAKISLTYEKKALFAEFYSLYNGSKKLEDYSNSGEDNLNYATAQGMPAWFTFNSRIGYSINTMMNLQFGVENILDTEYRVFASGINAPGRNFYFALKLQY
jgi:hemoglobin/transferrin/lactoferrin receptor protein